MSNHFPRDFRLRSMPILSSDIFCSYHLMLPCQYRESSSRFLFLIHNLAAKPNPVEDGVAGHVTSPLTSCFSFRTLLLLDLRLIPEIVEVSVVPPSFSYYICVYSYREVRSRIR